MIDLEKALATGEIDWDDEDETAFLKVLEDLDRTQTDRFRQLSRLSGLEVTNDLSDYGEPWWPIYQGDAPGPVAWFNPQTGERHEGPDRPEGVD